MKVLFLFLGALSFYAAHADVTPPTLVQANFETGYVPVGFDSNDNVQLVGEGMFPNTCYKQLSVSKKIDFDKKIVYVQQNVYKFPPPCLKMLVPFNNVVDVGLLPPGKYEVRDQKTNGALGELKVTPAKTNAADDFLYASVSEAVVRKSDESEGGTYKAVLSGAFTNSCLYVKEVKVSTEASNVVTVLPITESRTDQECLSGSFRFSQEVDLPARPEGRYLLHVRVMNGNSINKLFDVLN